MTNCEIINLQFFQIVAQNRRSCTEEGSQYFKSKDSVKFVRDGKGLEINRLIQ